jgi:hypothetical protein
MTRGPVDVPSAARSRLRRAHVWLCTALFVHCTTFVFVVVAVAGGSIRPTGAAVAAAVLAAVSLTVLPWLERLDPVAKRPARWLRRGSAVVTPHAVAFGIAASALYGGGAPLAWWQAVQFACAGLVIELMAVALASRALRWPLSAELGEMDVEVQVKLRSSAEWLPVWLSHDDVTLTGEALITTLRPGGKWAFMERIGLADIVDVDTRQTTAEDGPWFITDDGQRFWPPAGQAIVITHRLGTRQLPVHDAERFAVVLRARVHAFVSGN